MTMMLMPVRQVHLWGTLDGIPKFNQVGHLRSPSVREYSSRSVELSQKEHDTELARSISLPN